MALDTAEMQKLCRIGDQHFTVEIMVTPRVGIRIKISLRITANCLADMAFLDEQNIHNCITNKDFFNTLTAKGKIVKRSTRPHMFFCIFFVAFYARIRLRWS